MRPIRGPVPERPTMPERCRYLAEIHPDYRVEFRPFKGHPWSGRNAQGYGRKIPTDWAIHLGSRWHRVYVCCYSNIGTAYIRTTDHPFLVVRDYDLPERSTASTAS
jgi:hypothetical protein